MLQWPRKTTRYPASELRRTRWASRLGVRKLPTGLGTSAERIPGPVR